MVIADRLALERSDSGVRVPLTRFARPGLGPNRPGPGPGPGPGGAGAGEGAAAEARKERLDKIKELFRPGSRLRHAW